ncbi:hypothetical protein WMY93_034165, partial [Mugilogobius chulae]
AKDGGLTRIRAGSTPVVNITDFNEAETQCTDSSQLTGSCEAWSLSSECDLTITDTSIPKLRRTKSIEMRGRIDYDSDELFDPSSDDSGEEYIPKSGEDSSEDTDTKNVLFDSDQDEDPLDSNETEQDQESAHKSDSPVGPHLSSPLQTALCSATVPSPALTEHNSA